MTTTRRTALAAPLILLPALARAQAGWPRQSIRFVVPFAMNCRKSPSRFRM